MSMVVRFSPEGMTTEQYEAVKRRLSEQDIGPRTDWSTTSVSVKTVS